MMATPWRNCRASITLVDEINRRWPGRDRSSDGTIGDAAHATRTSDHNPWIVVDGVGVVRARDVDKDGIDAPWLAEFLRNRGAVGDPRLTGGGYVIFNRRITTPDFKGWKAYTGANPHVAHLHLSLSRNRAGFDSAAAWGITGGPPAPAPNPALTEALMSLTKTEAAQLGLLLQQMIGSAVPYEFTGWQTWPGGSTRADGKPDAFTLVDYARKANQRAEDIVRSLDALHRKVDQLAAVRPVEGVLDSVDAAGALTADEVRDILRAALADLGPLHLTTKETP